MSDEPTLRALMLVEEPDSGDILRCVFGLHERDVDTYLALRATGEASAGELADGLDRDRSTVARALTRLHEKDVTERHRVILDHGGEMFCYEAVPLPELKSRMHEELTAWADYVHGRIEEFEEDDAVVAPGRD
ncbi:TrmB family transcriptional regulator [Halobacterium sp. DL1]|jgi:predicted transcriptional regulator|nr:TrmB family transcriptional regulator [Halobacterium sp. DL1]